MHLLIRFAAVIVLLLLPVAASAKWREASSTHFLVYSESSPESLHAFATKLERFDKGMRRVHGLPDRDLGPANRLTVYVVSSVEAVQRLARGAPNVAGFYLPRAEGSIAVIPRRAGEGGTYDITPETILLHEYAHHFMLHNYVGVFPAWLTEGFAEFNATARFEKDGGIGFGLPALHRASALMGDSALPIEATLDPIGRKFSADEREATLDGRGWLLTHYLTFEPSRKGQLRAYLAALNAGKPSLDAARSAFGDLKQLNKELNKYLLRPRLPYRPLAAAEIVPGPVVVREMSPGESAVMDLRIQSKRGVNATEAKEVVRQMRRAAAPFPGDPVVQEALAEAEFDAGNLAEAEAAADRALAVDAKRVDALIYKGRALMGRAEKDRGDSARWKEVRRWLAAANRADPDDPEPLILFHESFGREGRAPTANAVEGLLTAFHAAPQDRSLRLSVAHQYLIDGKTAEARATLVPLAFDPHGQNEAKRVAAILERLDSGGAQAALAAWSAGDDKDKPGE